MCRRDNSFYVLEKKDCGCWEKVEERIKRGSWKVFLILGGVGMFLFFG